MGFGAFWVFLAVLLYGIASEAGPPQDPWPQRAVWWLRAQLHRGSEPLRAHRAPARRDHWSGTIWESCYDSGMWRPFPRPLVGALGQITRCANESGVGALRADGWA